MIIATAVLAVVGIFNGLRMVATHWAYRPRATRRAAHRQSSSTVTISNGR